MSYMCKCVIIVYLFEVMCEHLVPPLLELQLQPLLSHFECVIAYAAQHVGVVVAHEGDVLKALRERP